LKAPDFLRKDKLSLAVKCFKICLLMFAMKINFKIGNCLKPRVVLPYLFFLKSFFVSVPLRQKTQSFPSSQSSITNRKELNLKNAEKHFRLLIRLGDWLHTVIEYNTAVRIENPWWLRERCLCLSLSSLNAKTDTLKC